MHIETIEPHMNRRDLICGAGLLAALGPSQAHATAETGGVHYALTPEQQALEAANEALDDLRAGRLTGAAVLVP